MSGRGVLFATAGEQAVRLLAGLVDLGEIVRVQGARSLTLAILRRRSVYDPYRTAAGDPAVVFTVDQ